jgi:U3 small nucleolar ribonucleoprotein protein IMP4
LNQVTDLVILHEHRGDPDGLIVCHLPHGPTAYFGLSNVVMRHDIETKETIPEAYVTPFFLCFFVTSSAGTLTSYSTTCDRPATDISCCCCGGAFQTLNPFPIFFCRRSTLGQRTATILKHMFPVPKAESKRIMTFANRSESIQFRHHLYRRCSPPAFPPILKRALTRPTGKAREKISSLRSWGHAST